jgi:SAM-dependent methyltransferase
MTLVSRKIFDMSALRLHQKRSNVLEPVDFLDKFAVGQVIERLSDMKRTFKYPLIVGRKTSSWAKNISSRSVTLIDDDNHLDFNNNKFDLIIHALSLHRHNDPVGQLIQIRRALRPDGLMIAIFLGGETLQELRVAFEAAELKLENGISPRVAPMIEIRDAGDLLVRAGFALSVADKTDLEVIYNTPIELLHDLRRMGETNIMVDRRKTFLKKSTLNKFEEIYSSQYKSDKKGGGVKATFQFLCLTGWAPSDNQQKPLRRGSATHKFSDILGTYKL